ncbi:GNAT family N-acetyltransferase [Flavobacterium sp. PL12]|uniref:GNAT family N-acetyltransferase n=1 Tax=Flavobacterium sp. PL12 TaxID=3071718 RepID=UPI00319E59F9
MVRALIRPLEISDALTSWKWRNNSKIWELTGSSPNKEITYEIEYDWIQKAIKDCTSKRFAILADDVYVGNIQLTNIIDIDAAEFHIFIGDTDYWGKGIAKLATYQILYYAKEVLSLKLINLKVKEENYFAIATYEKNGFVRTYKDTEDGWLNMTCDLKKLNNPEVNVCVMVYNHESFIEECISGLLMQKCNFNFDIIVGEDGSSDNSREILKNYQSKFPGKFKLLLHNENIGATKNQIEIFNNCTGNFIAICEGDDYWTDPLKLQKQFDILNNDSSIGLVYTKCSRTDSSKLVGKKIVGNDLFYSNKIPTLTTVFSREILNNYIRNVNLENKNWQMGDYPMWLWFHIHSNIYFLDTVTACYRVLNNSASHFSDGNKRVLFNINSFEMTDFFAEGYLDKKEYNLFLNKGLFFLSLSAMRHKSNLLWDIGNRIKNLDKKSLNNKILLLFLKGYKFLK